jgi:SOS response regulatory protein OraA/RecX
VLRQELLGLGVDAEVVREALEGFDAGESAYRAARALSGKLKETEYPVFRRRLWSHLQRRGFEGNAIGDAVNRLWRELTDPLDGDVDAGPDEQ